LVVGFDFKCWEYTIRFSTALLVEHVVQRI
jgi:hypothetical protein